MNERIKQLQSQCWEERPYGPLWFNSTKFAELLIRECADVVYDYRNEPGLNIMDKVFEHFEIEEFEDD